MMLGWKGYLRRLGYSVHLPMADRIKDWRGWYMAENSFYNYTEKTDDRTFRVKRLSCRPARMVCQEWASLLFSETTMISVDDEAANSWLESWLKSVRFVFDGQELIEQAFAVGTGAWVLRAHGVAEGQRYTPDAYVGVARFDARHIIPLTYDASGCDEAAFLSRTFVRGQLMTQLEIHTVEGGYHVARTVLFDSRGRQVDDDAIGVELVSELPMFSIFRTGLANPYWEWSPFGMSVFDDAIGAVQLVDTAFDNMWRDIYLGQKMLFISEDMLSRDKNGDMIVPRQKDQQLFRKTETDPGKSGIDEYNPDLRVADNRLAFQTAVEILGTRAGFGPEYFTTGGESGIKTATEVIADQSGLFRTLRKHENALSPAITRIIRGAIALHNSVTGQSLNVPDVVQVMFDDSVIEDSTAQKKLDLEEIAAGVQRPWEYRTRWKGEDEKTAKAMAPGFDEPFGDEF